MADEFVSVGKLGKPHGLSGAFRFLFDRLPKSKKQLPAYFFIGNVGTTAPRFVKEIELLSIDSGFIRFEGIDTPEQAKLFSGKILYLLQADANKLFRKNAAAYQYIVGYSLVNEKGEKVGTINELHESTAQTLIEVDTGSKLVLVPLVDEWVIDENKRNKTITMEIPDGLLDL